MIGILITLLCPLTLFFVESRNLNNIAAHYADALANRFRLIIAGNPALWRFQTEKYLKSIYETAPPEHIGWIEVLDEKGNPVIFFEFFKEGADLLKDSTGTAPILFNNQLLGTIRVGLSRQSLLKITILIGALSLIIGCGISFLVYRFPVEVVKGAEREIHELLVKLNQTKEELEIRIQERTKELWRANEILGRAHDELEQRVIERTAKLQAASQALEEDIAERKRVEEVLKDSEERYRTAIEHSNDGVSLVKGDTHLYANQKFLEMFGYNHPEEIIGKSLITTVHPDDRDRVTEIILKRQRGEGAPSKYEFKGIRKNGSIIYMRFLRQRPLIVVKHGLRGPPARRGRAKAAVGSAWKSMREKYRTLFEGAAEGIIVADVARKANPSLGRSSTI